MIDCSQNTQSEGNTNPRFRKVCFTLNNYSEEEYSQILTVFNGMKYIIGKEVGEGGTPHLQGYVEFGRQLTFKTLKAYNERWHLEKPKGSRKANIAYCSKEGDFVTTFPVPIRDQIISAYAMVTWKSWQQKLLDELQLTPCPRKILWYWETKGNVGKSFLCKFLWAKFNAIICSGKTADVFNQVKAWMDENEGQAPSLIVCDIPRSNYDYLNYGCLEKLKDGLIYSGKFEGGVCAFPQPAHIVCFANDTPFQEQMSADRWDIRQIH